VNVSDGSQLWSERYDRELEDVFAIQDDIAESIVKALRVILGDAERKALKEPAELALFSALESTRGSAMPMLERGDYTGYLKSFAVLKKPVDAFFDTVMVMAKEDALRRNRLALLRELREAMNRVADISKLAQ